MPGLLPRCSGAAPGVTSDPGIEPPGEIEAHEGGAWIEAASGGHLDAPVGAIQCRRRDASPRPIVVAAEVADECVRHPLTRAMFVPRSLKTWLVAAMLGWAAPGLACDCVSLDLPARVASADVVLV